VAAEVSQLERQTAVTGQAYCGEHSMQNVALTTSEDDEDPKRRREMAVALLQSWREEVNEQAQEQCETWSYLQRALNANALSARKRV
jgi:hypothetical protein